MKPFKLLFHYWIILLISCVLSKVSLVKNTTGDHGKEFVKLGGLKPLLDILQMKNLPIGFSSSQACQCVATLCQSILVSDNIPIIIQQKLLFYFYYFRLF